MAEPDQIVVAGVLKELCGDDAVPGGFKDLGRATLKGFVSAVQLYAVEWRESATGDQ